MNQSAVVIKDPRAQRLLFPRPENIPQSRTGVLRKEVGERLAGARSRNKKRNLGFVEEILELKGGNAITECVGDPFLLANRLVKGL